MPKTPKQSALMIGPLQQAQTLEKLMAKKVSIPAGRIPEIRPNFPTEAALLAEERDEIRKQDPSDARIKELTYEINSIVQEHCREKWRNQIENMQAGSKKLWSTIKSLSNPRKQDLPIISFGSYTPTDPKKCSAALNRQFVEHPTKPSREKRVVLRKIRELPSNHEEELEISCETVSRMIRDAKNAKAIGPDGIATVMLKHLGVHGINYLTKTFNIYSPSKYLICGNREKLFPYQNQLNLPTKVAPTDLSHCYRR